MGASEKQREARAAKRAEREARKAKPRRGEGYDKPGSGHRERSPRKDVKESRGHDLADDEALSDEALAPDSLLDLSAETPAGYDGSVIRVSQIER